MSFRSAIPFLLLVVFAAAVAAGQPRSDQVASASDLAFQSGDAAGDDRGKRPEPFSVSVPGDVFDNAPRVPIVPDLSRLPLTADQEGCQRVGGIARLDSESFDGRRFPIRGGAWTVSDLHGTRPGFLDDVMWGQADCEATVGLKSLWSVGGGRIGATLNCDAKEYYTEQRAQGGIRTLLRYGPLNLSAGNPIGPRVTFDYKAKMPENSLFIGIADGSVRNQGGTVNYRGYRDLFTADTGGDWVRGEAVGYDSRVEFDQFFSEFKNRDQVEIGFFYQDPVPDPAEGPPTAGMYGAFIDNVHIDVKYVRRPCRIPSPTSNEEPSLTPTPTSINTPTPITPSATPATFKTPVPLPTQGPIMLPFLVGTYDRSIIERTPIPTVPSETPSTTPTPSNTPTPTYTPTTAPTYTPPPPPTPTRTPRPSPTDVPEPKVIISYVRPMTLGAVDLEIVEIANVGTGPLDVTEWRVFYKEEPWECYLDGARKTIVLNPGDAFEVRTGPDAENGMRDGDNGPVDGWACTDDFVINNNLDRITLFDEFDSSVHRVCYDLEGYYPCWAQQP